MAQMGLGWPPAIALGAMVNFGFAAVAWFGIRWLSKNLSFRASRRHLTGNHRGKICDPDHQTEA
jgi:hypothetical protein